jgi:fused signal recognition particle receptor
MHGNAGGLVDDEHQSVAVEQPGNELFRGHAPAYPGEGLAASSRHAHLEPMANEDVKESRPGLFGRLFGRGLAEVQPEPMPSPEPSPVSEAPPVIAPQLPVIAPEPSATPAAPPEPKQSWWKRLSSGLSRSSSALGQGITDIFTKRMLDTTTLEDLEDVLVRADLGIDAASRISEALGRGRYDREIDPQEVRTVLATEVERSLTPVALPLKIDWSKRPFIVLVVGVNGSGKTTTIGKIASKYRAEGRSVILAAGDTFRAAAIEQLRIWGARIGADVIAREQGSDAASLAFEAVQAAKAEGADLLLIDTAGRLQNRAELMSELEKIVRVIKKIDSAAPHAVLLVLDATVGQNALSQVEIFARIAGVTGLVMTKLDGTARGGILVAIAEKYKMPVHFIGVGESADDLEPFEARDFARAIAGLE